MKKISINVQIILIILVILVILYGVYRTLFKINEGIK